MAPETVSQLLLATQWMDSLEKMADGKATTIFVPHNPGAVADVAAQIRDGSIMARAAGGR